MNIRDARAIIHTYPNIHVVEKRAKMLVDRETLPFLETPVSKSEVTGFLKMWKKLQNLSVIDQRKYIHDKWTEAKFIRLVEAIIASMDETQFSQLNELLAGLPRIDWMEKDNGAAFQSNQKLLEKRYHKALYSLAEKLTNDAFETLEGKYWVIREFCEKNITFDKLFFDEILPKSYNNKLSGVLKWWDEQSFYANFYFNDNAEGYRELQDEHASWLDQSVRFLTPNEFRYRVKRNVEIELILAFLVKWPASRNVQIELNQKYRQKILIERFQMVDREFYSLTSALHGMMTGKPTPQIDFTSPFSYGYYLPSVIPLLSLLGEM